MGYPGSWAQFCKEFLTGALEQEWSKVQNGVGLNYLEVRESDTSKVVPMKVNTWKSLTELMEKTGAASSDAMVLNIFVSAIPIFLPQNHSCWNN